MNHPFYQVKGALPANAPSYIKRDADDQLYDALIHHKYCYVLNYRQVGKSSLKNSCASRLEKKGHKCVHIDLTAIGSKDIDVEQWYFSFISSISRRLNLSQRKVMEYWLKKNLTVISRVALIFDELILKETSEQITIFVDEIDFILSINKFNTDNFFALIRRFYNLRGEDKRYNRLTFVLLGVASANDLMQDSSRTPFNIAENIKISQLRIEQSHRLMDGLNNQKIDKKEILERVFRCTAGTSFLTQKILEYISKHPIENLKEVDNIVDKLFIQEGFNEVNLSNIQERIIKNETHNVKMLYTIEQIQNGMKIEEDGREQTFIYLKLSGLIKVKDGILVYSNLIYKRIFNAFWLEKMIDKLDRPILKYLQKWEQHNLENDYLLKEEKLKEVTRWAYSRSDLLAIEHEYLSLSHQEENRKSRIKLEEEQKKIVEKFLEEEKKFNQQLLEEKEKVNKKLLEEKEKANEKLLKEKQKSNQKLLRQKRIMAGITVIIILSTIGILSGGFYYYIDKKEEIVEKKLENEVLQKQNLKLNIERLRLENKEISLKIENKKQEEYYTKLLNSKLKGGTKEYYMWQIDQYEFMEKNKGNHRVDIIEASINLAKLLRNREQSEKYYMKAIELYKKDENKYEKEVGKLYYQLAVKTDNLTYYTKALDFYKKNPLTYGVKIAQIYYQMGDIFISNKNIKQAKYYYKEGFKLHRSLWNEKPSTYISLLADSLLKKASIHELKNNRISAKACYIKALNIYKYDSNDYNNYKITQIEEKLKTYPNKKIKRTRGWVYLGEFLKENKTWKKQHFWFQKKDTIKLKQTPAIALGSVYFRARPSIKAKHLRDVAMGDRINILETKTLMENDENHIWAYVLY
jgi:hypothetical protein